MIPPVHLYSRAAKADPRRVACSALSEINFPVPADGCIFYEIVERKWWKKSGGRGNPPPPLRCKLNLYVCPVGRRDERVTETRPHCYDPTARQLSSIKRGDSPKSERQIAKAYAEWQLLVRTGKQQNNESSRDLSIVTDTTEASPESYDRITCSTSDDNNLEMANNLNSEETEPFQVSGRRLVEIADGLVYNSVNPTSSVQDPECRLESALEKKSHLFGGSLKPIAREPRALRSVQKLKRFLYS
ncbi:unnamed protein product, partial [Iphiclides podalirius]